MKSISSPIATEAANDQSAWTELYDFYLPAAITTPFGSTAILRLCGTPGGFSFFTPTTAPEPTPGQPQQYTFWPLKRGQVTSSNKFSNDKLTITASNVTGEWAAMLAAVDWEGVAVIIRKVSHNIPPMLADDAVILFAGNIDSAKIDLQTISLAVSNDFGSFAVQLPTENMHANCRFQWGDDQCTKLKWHPDNYRAKTCGSGSTTTNVKSAGLTEDTSTNGSYGTDLVNALSNGAITTSSEQAGAITAVNITWLPSQEGHQAFSFSVPSGVTPVLADGEQIKFAGSPLPSGVTAGTFYYVIRPIAGANYYFFGPTLGAYINDSLVGGSCTATGASGNAGYQVKVANAGYWKMGDAADWGANNQGYWQIPDAQAGVGNSQLKPWITFDFGSAVRPRLWQVQGVSQNDREQLLRLIYINSSTDNFVSNAKLETWFEMPPQENQLFEIVIPQGSTARYWRICVRTRWSDTLRYSMFSLIRAYAETRHWWRDGQITFDAATSTVALRGVTRQVLESYAGEIVCAPLPVAPAAGDTFTISRGCNRTFNACAVRQNVENFGGFDTLPYQTVIR